MPWGYNTIVFPKLLKNLALGIQMQAVNPQITTAYLPARDWQWRPSVTMSCVLKTHLVGFQQKIWKIIECNIEWILMNSPHQLTSLSHRGMKGNDDLGQLVHGWLVRQIIFLKSVEVFSKNCGPNEIFDKVMTVKCEGCLNITSSILDQPTQDNDIWTLWI